jgi:glycosyltransferase involved in cell wall biosynthesis
VGIVTVRRTFSPGSTSGASTRRIGARPAGRTGDGTSGAVLDAERSRGIDPLVIGPGNDRATPHASEGDRPLRVCLDAREPTTGGVRQTLIGLAHGLARVGGPDEYLFLVRPGFHRWLDPYLRGPCRALPLEGAEADDWRQWLRRRLPPRTLERIASHPLRALAPVRVPSSDGTVERAGVDVVHLCRQAGFVTELPTIYSPHDLQHVHLPRMFTAYERRWRRTIYPALAQRARAVVALTHAGREDIHAHLHVDPERIFVIRWAPILDAYPAPDEEAASRLRTERRIPAAFALYPAHTFAHKNHVRLVEAIAALRDEGLEVPLVCVGGEERNHGAASRRIRSLRVGHLVRFMGYVPERELRALYGLARILVFPSLFEGFGMPVWEAFRAGTPVACSDIPPLAEIAGDAAVRFDPSSPRAIAAAIRKLWDDPELRRELAARGGARVAPETWEAVARRYRALYRLAAGRAPSPDDEQLLAGMR